MLVFLDKVGLYWLVLERAGLYWLLLDKYLIQGKVIGSQ